MDDEIFICDEMKKLRDALDKVGIPWEDWSRGNPYPVCCTKFRIGRTRYSVINGYGSYGGYWERSKLNKGLLEVMRNNKAPKGWLTAAQVLEYCEITINESDKENDHEDN